MRNKINRKKTKYLVFMDMRRKTNRLLFDHKRWWYPKSPVLINITYHTYPGLYERLCGIETAGFAHACACGSKMAPITGQDAGIPHLLRFSGCIIMDDMHKPKDIGSEIVTESVIENYNATVKMRLRGPNVPHMK